MSRQSRMLMDIEKVIKKTFHIPWQDDNKRRAKTQHKSKPISKNPSQHLTLDKSPDTEYKSRSRYRDTYKEQPEEARSEDMLNSKFQTLKEASTGNIGSFISLETICQRLVECADRLMAYVDITDVDREIAMKQYIRQKENLLAWLEQKQEGSEQVQQDRSGCHINEAAEEENDQLLQLNQRILSELTKMKLEMDQKQERVDELWLENESLAKDLAQQEQLWRLESTRSSNLKNKCEIAEHQLDIFKSLLRKFTIFDEIQEYFWLIEEFSNQIMVYPVSKTLQKIRKEKQTVEDKMINQISELGYDQINQYFGSSPQLDRFQEEKTQWTVDHTPSPQAKGCRNKAVSLFTTHKIF